MARDYGKEMVLELLEKMKKEFQKYIDEKENKIKNF